MGAPTGVDSSGQQREREREIWARDAKLYPFARIEPSRRSTRERDSHGRVVVFVCVGPELTAISRQRESKENNTTRLLNVVCTCRLEFVVLGAKNSRRTDTMLFS